MKLQIHQIKVDPKFQKRLDGLNMKTVQEYAQVLSNGEQLPAITVYEVDEVYYVVDGFHRVAAHRVCALDIDAEVVKGTYEEAYDYCRFEANKKNGMRLSSGDKKEIILEVLRDERFAEKTVRELSKLIGVHHSWIVKVRKTINLTKNTAISPKGEIIQGETVWRAEVPDREEIDRKKAARKKVRRMDVLTSLMFDFKGLLPHLNEDDKVRIQSNCEQILKTINEDSI